MAGLRTDTWEWVRPVCATPRGAIPTNDCLIDGEPLRPLDLIEVDLLAAEPKLYQAENFLMSPKSIQLLGRANLGSYRASLQAVSLQENYLSEDPINKVTPETFVGVLSPQPSLALIKVDQATIFGEHKSRYLMFEYKSKYWNLKLTDENFLPDRESDQIGPCYLCLSLGEYSEDRAAHWKFVASVIPV